MPLRILAAIWLSFALFNSVRAQMPVESGISELARQIVHNSQAKNLKSIAIVPFQSSDGTYSELSNFLVDELVLQLFTVPDNTMRIIERQQLGTMLSEMSLGWADIVAADTTQKLGKVHGVEGLVIGSITDMGEMLRITARLIQTETGSVFSAAAVNVAKSPTIISLLQRKIVLPQGGVRPTQGGAVASPTRMVGSSVADPDEYSDKFIRATISSTAKSKDNKKVTVSVNIENISEKEVRLSLWGPPSFIDNAGVEYQWIANTAGISNCNSSDWYNVKRNCANRGAYALIQPLTRTNFSFVFNTKDEAEGQTGDLSVRLLAFTEEKQAEPGSFTMGITRIPLGATNK
jgi:TolB-like protein